MNNRIGLAVGGLAVAFVMVGGTALGAVSSAAAIPDPSGIIHGCFNSGTALGTGNLCD